MFCLWSLCSKLLFLARWIKPTVTRLTREQLAHLNVVLFCTSISFALIVGNGTNLWLDGPHLDAASIWVSSKLLEKRTFCISVISEMFYQRPAFSSSVLSELNSGFITKIPATGRIIIVHVLLQKPFKTTFILYSEYVLKNKKSFLPEKSSWKLWTKSSCSMIR